MTISVVIPTYNEEKYLPAALDSIRKLQLEPNQILIVDSNSTDKTRAIAKKYHVSIINIRKRGIGFARQMGLQHATGDIIAFTDADTVVPKDWLDKIVSTLKIPGVSAVYGNFRVPDGWLPYRFHINILQPLLIRVYHAIGCPMAPGQNTAFWKKQALAAGGYPTKLKIAEDLEMIHRLRKVGKIVYRKDNYVTSSGRRGNEGWPLLIRAFSLSYRYIFRQNLEHLSFPDFR